MAEEAAPAAAAAAPPARKGGWLMKAAILAVVLVGAAGGGAWWFMRGTAAEAMPVEPGPETRGLVAFETFLVNLSDAGGQRFLKLNLQLVLATNEDASAVTTTPVLFARLRSDILELLTQQTGADLVTTEGKTKLKALIKQRANAVVSDNKVIDVLFAEFVVQF
jgi:flagellar FliL protein